MNFFFFPDHVDTKHWDCLNFRRICPLTLFSLCFIGFSSILFTFAVRKKRNCFFSVEYFLGIFGTGMIIKLLEVVISSGGVSEGSMVLRALNKVSAEIVNYIWVLIIEIAGTQNGAIFGGAVSIIYSFAGIRNGEQIFRHSCCSKQKYLLVQNHLYQHQRQQLYCKQTQLGAPCDIEWFITRGFVF